MSYADEILKKYGLSQSKTSTKITGPAAAALEKYKSEKAGAKAPASSASVPKLTAPTIPTNTQINAILHPGTTAQKTAASAPKLTVKKIPTNTEINAALHPTTSAKAQAEQKATTTVPEVKKLAAPTVPTNTQIDSLLHPATTARTPSTQQSKRPTNTQINAALHPHTAGPGEFFIPSEEFYAEASQMEDRVKRAENAGKPYFTAVEKAYTAFTENPTQANYDAYVAAAEKAKPYFEEYEDAVAQYNDYVTEQTGKYNAWRSTVRSSDAIQSDIDDIDAKIAEREEQKATVDTNNAIRRTDAQSMGYDPADDETYLTQVATSSRLGTEIKQLQNEKARLQAEMSYSQYFHYTGMMDNADFEEYSKKGAEKANGEAAKYGTSLQEKNRIGMLTDDELSVYHYLVAKDAETGGNSAETYLSYMQDTQNSRAGTAIGEGIRGMENGVIRGITEGAFGFLSGVDSGIRGIEQSFSKEQLPTSANQYASQYIQQDLANGKGFGNWAERMIYDTGNTVGNMAPSILVSTILSPAGATGAAVGALTQGLSSGGNAYAQALAEGYTPRQAAQYGKLVGASEAGLQYLLGGIGKLGGVTSRKILTKVAAFESGLKRAFATGAIRIGSEITEEELQLLLEPAIRSAIFGEDYDAPTLEETAYTAVLTILTTGILESGEIANAARSPINAENTAPKDGVQYEIKRDINGKQFVDVTEDMYDAADGESVARTIQKVIAKKFNNLIDANGQKIQINKTTNDEFRRSELANELRKVTPQAYSDKLRTIVNADEILRAANNWIGEEIKHERKDDIVEFGRGNVMYRVGENGYVADVIVGIRKNGAAVLYDLINIYETKIAEDPFTMASHNDSQRIADASAADMLSQGQNDVNSPTAAPQLRVPELPGVEAAGTEMSLPAEQSGPKRYTSVENGAASAETAAVMEQIGIPTAAELRGSETGVKGLRAYGTTDPAKQEQFRKAESIAKRFGATLQVAELDSGAAGSYENGVITISPSSSQPVMEVFVHELTHHLERKRLYGKFASFMMSHMVNDQHISLQALSEAVAAEYAAAGKTLTPEGAEREVLAKYTAHTFFENEAFINRLASEDRNVFHAIKNWIDRTVKLFTGTAEERFLIRAQRKYARALKSATVGTDNGTQHSFADKRIPTYEELIAKDNIRPVDLRRSSEDDISFKDFRRSDEAKEILKTPVLNNDTGEQIFVIDATFRHSFFDKGINKISAARNIRRLLENAVLTHSEPSYKERDHSTGVYTLFSIAITEDGLRPVKIKVKEYYNEGQRIPQNVLEQIGNDYDKYASAYDNRVLVLDPEEGIEIESGASVATPANRFALVNYTPDSTIRVSELYNLVNSEYQKYLPIRGTPTADDIRRPTVRKNGGTGQLSTGSSFGDLVNATNPDAARQSTAAELKAMLENGASIDEIRAYVNSVTPQNAQSGTETVSPAAEVSEAQQIVNTAHAAGMSVDEYLRENWERYEYDGELNEAAREALETERATPRYLKAPGIARPTVTPSTEVKRIQMPTAEENAPTAEGIAEADAATELEREQYRHMGKEYDSREEMDAVRQRDIDELFGAVEHLANKISEDGSTSRLAAPEDLVNDEYRSTEKTATEKSRDVWNAFRRKMVDTGETVDRVGKAIGDRHLYQYFNSARASTNAATSMITDNRFDVMGKNTGKGLNDIFSPIRKKGAEYYRNFQLYLYHMHNADRMSRYDQAAVDTARAAFEKFKVDNPRLLTFADYQIEQMAKDEHSPYYFEAGDYVALRDTMRRTENRKDVPVFGYNVKAEDSRSEAARLKAANPEFEALAQEVYAYIDNLLQYRVDSGLITEEDRNTLKSVYPHYVPTYRVFDTSGSAKINKDSVKIGSTIGRAVGGDEALMPLHKALAAQTFNVVREGSKNRFGQRLLHSNAQRLTSTREHVREVKEYQDAFSENTFDAMEDTAPKRTNTFVVHENGKAYEITVSPELYEGVKSLSPEPDTDVAVMKVARTLNKVYKNLITGYNPLFMARNFVRDLQDAGLYSKDLSEYVKHYPKAWKEIATNGEYWQRYKALGGTFSSVFDYDTGNVGEGGWLRNVTRKVEAVSGAIEQSARLAEFMATVDKAGGLENASMEGIMEAMYNAADITTNFGRSGSWGKTLNATFAPFLNPGIQGFSKAVRSVTEQKGVRSYLWLAAKAATMGVGPVVLNSIFNGDDEEWEDIRDSDKDLNYLFKLKDGTWLKIPKGRMLSAIGIVADRIGDTFRGEDVDVLESVKTALGQIAPSNPFTTNLVMPFIESELFNKSNPGTTWYGSDIENQRMQQYAPAERYDAKTDEISKWLGKQTGLSPAKINYLLNQYTGVVGDVFLPIFTQAAERDMFSAAFTLDSTASNRISGDFYSKLDELTFAKNRTDSTGYDNVVFKYFNKQTSAVGEVNRAIREIEADTSLSSSEKRELLDAQYKIRNGLQKKTLADVEAYAEVAKVYYDAASDMPEDEREDYAYRMANYEVFGAEYALQTYNKNVYAKAQEANEEGVSYDTYYEYYFATRDLEADKNSKGETVSGSKKKKVLNVINGLDISKDEKDVLYYAAGYSAKTIKEAPWRGGSSAAAKKKTESGSKPAKTSTSTIKAPEVKKIVLKAPKIYTP